MIKNNITALVNPVEQSIANIDMHMTKEEIEKILKPIYINSIGYHTYREGLSILWDTITNQPHRIVLSPGIYPQEEELSKHILIYRGAIDFGPEIGHKHIGDSFANQFDMSRSESIEKDEKAQNFIVSLYNYLNNTEINCIEAQKCKIEQTPLGKIVFDLPSLNLVFRNENKRELYSLVFKQTAPNNLSSSL